MPAQNPGIGSALPLITVPGLLYRAKAMPRKFIQAKV